LKTLVTILLLVLVSFSYGQGNSAGFDQAGNGSLKPDFKTINQEISDQKSNFYLPKLIERYNHSDTTLTLEEFQHLYYGYSLLNPYLPIPHNDKVEKVKLLRSKALDYLTSVEMCNSLLKSDMFDLDFYIIKTVNKYELDRNKPQSEQSIKFYYGLCKAILMSGTGEDYYSPIYITHPNHADFICYILGLTPSGKTISLEKNYYVAVNENMFNIKGVFFEIIKNEYVPETIAQLNKEKESQEKAIAQNDNKKPKSDKEFVAPTQNSRAEKEKTIQQTKEYEIVADKDNAVTIHNPRTEKEKVVPTTEHKTRTEKEFIAPTHATRTEKEKPQPVVITYKPRDKKEFIPPTPKRREEKEKVVQKYIPTARDTINEEVEMNREIRDSLIAEKLRDQELAKLQRQKELEEKLALRNKIIKGNQENREKSMIERKASIEKFLKERDLLLRFKDEQQSQEKSTANKYY